MIVFVSKKMQIKFINIVFAFSRPNHRRDGLDGRPVPGLLPVRVRPVDREQPDPRVGIAMGNLRRARC
jgi:hypothetical protein